MQGTLQRNLRRVPARKSKQATIYCQAPYTVEKVHKITYLTDRLDSNMICRSRWESLVRNVDTGTLSSEDYRKYSKFGALQGVQEQLYWRQEDVRIIHACVSLLGNVREIFTTLWPGLRHNPVSFCLFGLKLHLTASPKPHSDYRNRDSFMESSRFSQGFIKQPDFIPSSCSTLAARAIFEEGKTLP